MKRILTTAALVAALTLGGASAAGAFTYPVDEPDVQVSEPTVAPGVPTVVSVTDIDPSITQVTFTSTGPSVATLSSLVAAAVASAPVVKPVVDGSASVTFSATTPGVYTVRAAGGGEELGSVQITVTGSSTGQPGGGDQGDDGLAKTGTDVPVGALIAGVGALGLGAVVLGAAAVRRRKQAGN